MANEIENLGTEVNETVGVMESARVLIVGFADYVRANVDNKAKLLEYANSLDGGANTLAADIAANPLPTEVVVPNP